MLCRRFPEAGPVLLDVTGLGDTGVSPGSPGALQASAWGVFVIGGWGEAPCWLFGLSMGPLLRGAMLISLEVFVQARCFSRGAILTRARCSSRPDKRYLYFCFSVLLFVCRYLTVFFWSYCYGC